jgi:hypothetical protein
MKIMSSLIRSGTAFGVLPCRTTPFPSAVAVELVPFYSITIFWLTGVCLALCVAVPAFRQPGGTVSYCRLLWCSDLDERRMEASPAGL